MAASIPAEIPLSVYQGDTLTFQKSLADYDLAEWALSYHFVSDDGIPKAFSFAADSTGLVEFNTATAEIGSYKGRGKVTKDGKSYTVWTGRLDILPGLESAVDVRTQNKRTFDNINAVLEGRASSTILNSKVEGTELYRIPHDDLIKLRDRYAELVGQEEQKADAAAGKPSKRNIYGYFT